MHFVLYSFKFFSPFEYMKCKKYMTISTQNIVTGQIIIVFILARGWESNIGRLYFRGLL